MKKIGLFVGLCLSAFLCLWTAFPGSIHAAEFQAAENFVLGAQEVLDEDLFVVGEQIVIEGTIEGDLFAAGATIRVDGEIRGTAYLAGQNILVTGKVQDDLFVAGYGAIIAGEVGEDLRAATGGEYGGMDPNMIQGLSPIADSGFDPYLPLTNKGLVLTADSVVRGDILIAAASTTLAGEVGRDVEAGVDQLILEETARLGQNLVIDGGSLVELNGTVMGDLTVTGADIAFGSSLNVGGMTTYSSPAPMSGAPAGATFEMQEQAAAPDTGPTWRLWAWRTATILLGSALLAFLTSRWLGRGCIEASSRAIRQRMSISLVWGIVSLMAVPLLLGLIPGIAWFFFGIPIAMMVFAVLATSWVLIWVFSPLVSGHSIGAMLSGNMSDETPDLTFILFGVLLVALLGRLSTMPLDGVLGGIVGGLGWFVIMLSYLLAVGGWVQTWGRGDEQAAR